MGYDLLYKGGLQLKTGDLFAQAAPSPSSCEAAEKKEKA